MQVDAGISGSQLRSFSLEDVFSLMMVVVGSLSCWEGQERAPQWKLTAGRHGGQLTHESMGTAGDGPPACRAVGGGRWLK